MKIIVKAQVTRRAQDDRYDAGNGQIISVITAYCKGMRKCPNWMTSPPPSSSAEHGDARNDAVGSGRGTGRRAASVGGGQPCTHEAGEVRFNSCGQVDHVLGAPLIRVSKEVPGEELLVDRAHTLLTPLNCPVPTCEEREKAESLLVGFLYLSEGRMRLYVRHQGNAMS